MSLKLKKRESVSSGLTRILRERLLIALRELHRAGADAEDAIHNARKRLKETRAVLRLLRSAIPEALYQTEKNLVRDAARPLSELRDSRVILDAVTQITKDEPSTLDVSSVRHELEARRASLFQRFEHDDTLRRLEGPLVKLLARIDTWPMDVHGWRTVSDGIRTAYHRGRQAMKAARASQDGQAADIDEKLHEWRKSSKVLWYQTQVLESAWPGLLEPLAEQIHELTDHLGDDHDLAVLRELVSADGASGLTTEDRDALLERLDHKRGKLEKDAFRAGQRIYAEKPKAFAKRLKRYWDAWRDDESHEPQGVSAGGSEASA